MSTLILKPKRLRPHHASARSDPYYGYGYRPDWPSILSVAHDEANGGRLFVCVDRPCLLGGSVAQLPLSVGGGLVVLEAEQVNAVRFRLWMSGPVPHGAAWAWGADGTGIFDPITNRPPNAGAGDCFDAPGPYAPAPPAVVVASGGGGTSATLTFDKAMVLTGAAIDDAMTFDGLTPIAVQADETSLIFELPGSVAAGDPWAIARQPAWLATPVAWPSSGTL